MKQDWDTAYRKHGVIQDGVSPLVREALPILKKNNVTKVLDHGSGTGRHTVFLAKNGFEVHGMDISKKANEITTERLKKEGLSAALTECDMSELPWKNDFFDAIVSTFVLAHGTKKDVELAFDEIERVLKGKGFFVLQVPSPKDGLYGQGKEIEPGTFLGVNDVDGDIPHHVMDEREVKRALRGFELIIFGEKTGFSKRRKCKNGFWKIIAQKK